ncbi:terminase small subunit [Clostridium rectalis]|uniref:terminase small subunit n=1 Tax=Clostridium rectalis TaxID=2040295 RepID=UPI0019D0C5D8|nr:terminase small subunit [Clostridium rectalis]
MSESAKIPKLTPRQKAFCDYYIQTGIGSEAARRAGYKGNNLDVIAAQNLTKLSIVRYLEDKMKEIDNNRIADAQEILEFLTRIIRNEEKDQLGLDASLQDRIEAAKALSKRYPELDYNYIIKIGKLKLEERKVSLSERQVDNLCDDIEYVVEDDDNEEDN